jgi:hypothetical protein
MTEQFRALVPCLARPIKKFNLPPYEVKADVGIEVTFFNYLDTLKKIAVVSWLASSL